MLTNKIFPLNLIFLFFILILNRYTSYNPFSLASNTALSQSTFFDFLRSPLVSLSIWTTILMLRARAKIVFSKKNSLLFILIVNILLLTLLFSFSISNIFGFYIIFEASLIPTFFIIIIWGYQPERIQASIYFIIYTITASLPLLIVIILWLKIRVRDEFLNRFLSNNILYTSHSWLYWTFCSFAFLFKIPIFSSHLWLPKAHVEAPVAGSIILAAVLLKLGGYGLIRTAFFSFSLYPKIFFFISSLRLIGGIFAGLICSRQQDLKALIAYSSIRHIRFVIIGIFSYNLWGWKAATILIISHGLCSSCLFILSNFNYDSFKTRRINIIKGLINFFPSVSFWWILGSLFNISAPPSINLISEITIIWRIINFRIFFIIPICFTRFITCLYSLLIYTLTNHGQETKINSIPSIPNNRIHSSSFLHLAPIILLIPSMPLFF